MKKVINFFAYIAIMFVAVAITIGSIWSAVSVLRTIGEIMAYVVTGISAYYYARSKQSPAFMIAFIIAAVLIVVMLVLGITIF
ncbi:MAG: hypothetical protein IJX26_00740 [Clostridia bacterium]|nr:hypothetical protein [Clostridia bacterium]